MKVDHSIILTIHNKDWLIDKVIQNIYQNTTGTYELIIILDGCTDNSEEVVYNNIKDDATVLYAANVFETTANNMGLRRASADKVIIVQDDMVITEQGWNERLQKPFDKFDDVFAVTARMSQKECLTQRTCKSLLWGSGVAKIKRLAQTAPVAFFYAAGARFFMRPPDFRLQD